MKVELTAKARKQLNKLPRFHAKKVAKKLLLLTTNPFEGKKLAGKLSERYSLRAWPYRIIYVIYRQRRLVQFDTIEHRQGTYI